MFYKSKRCDVQLKYIIMNDFFINTLSLKANYNCSGKEDKDLFSAQEAVLNTQEDMQVVISGNPVQKREGYIPGTRKKLWGIISKYPIFDEYSKIIGVVGTFIDITDRKMNERRRKLLEAVMEHIEETVWITKLKNRKNWTVEFIYFNKTVEKITGIDRDKLLKNYKLFWSRIHPDYAEAYKKYIEEQEHFPKLIEPLAK